MTTPMQFNVGIPLPKTVAELLELVSALRSRKAVYTTLISHLKICYQKSDTGPAEMKITRDDLATVSEKDIERTIIEVEERINYIDAQIEELQAQPFGPSTPPVAAIAAPVAAPAAAAAPAGKPAAAPAVGPKKEGTPSAKPRPQGGGPS